MLLSSAEPVSFRLSDSAPTPAPCVFEHIYFARPDSNIFGANVDHVRRRLGRELALEAPADADIVISVPDSSNTAALGYSQQSGLPYELGFIRNHYVGRTFIKPSSESRHFGVRVKFNPVRDIIAGQRIAVEIGRAHV